MKIKLIEQGMTKEITTKFGQKKKTSWKISTDGKEMFADVWDNKETDSWFPGETIEVEGLEPRDYNGKTYYTIKLKQVSFIDSIKDLEKRLTTMEESLAAINKRVDELTAAKGVRNGLL